MRHFTLDKLVKTMREQKFKDWMETAKKTNGKPYKISTVYDYPSRVRRVKKREEIKDIDNLASLENLIERYESAIEGKKPRPIKYMAGQKTIKDHLSALKKYHDFCVETHKD